MMEEGEIFVEDGQRGNMDQCKQCEKDCDGQDNLREHIETEHVLREPGKRKCYISNEGEKSIPEADLIGQMSEAVRIVNDKREELEKEMERRRNWTGKS